MSPGEVFDLQVEAVSDLLDGIETHFPLQLAARAEIWITFAEQVQRGLAIEDAARVTAQQWELS